jgi:hypothetical protein
LNPKLVSEELEKAYPAEAELGPLQHALERKLRSLPPPMDAKKLSRLYNHLLRRGFPGGAIRQELRRRLKMEIGSGLNDPRTKPRPMSLAGSEI